MNIYSNRLDAVTPNLITKQGDNTMLYINYKNEDGTIETAEDMYGMSKLDKKRDD